MDQLPGLQVKNLADHKFERFVGLCVFFEDPYYAWLGLSAELSYVSSLSPYYPSSEIQAYFSTLFLYRPSKHVFRPEQGRRTSYGPESRGSLGLASIHI